MITMKNNKQWIDILIAIHKTGSIRSASVELGVTYKTAWKRLNRLKNLYPEYELVATYNGGNRRGGTFITEDGYRILQELKLRIFE